MRGLTDNPMQAKRLPGGERFMHGDKAIQVRCTMPLHFLYAYKDSVAGGGRSTIAASKIVRFFPHHSSQKICSRGGWGEAHRVPKVTNGHGCERQTTAVGAGSVC